MATLIRTPGGRRTRPAPRSSVDTGPGARGSALENSLWRALTLYRVAAWVYAAGSMVFLHRADQIARSGLGWTVLAAMAGWTLAVAVLYRSPGRRAWPLLGVDLSFTIACLLMSVLVLESQAIIDGAPTVTVSWAAAPVLVWAVRGGPWGGGAAAVAVGAAAVLERGGASAATVNSLVLLLLAGVVVGYVVTLARSAEPAYAAAISIQAAASERERLARSVHDGVLQALALVSSRSAEPALARLAGEQEAALRRLVATPATPPPTGALELRGLLPHGADVELAAPDGPVWLPSHTAVELAAAVAAAVDNARRHGGGRAWLLVEDQPDGVTVTVRDEGPGVPPGRLEQAERDGRLGVAQSIRGRIADLGGTVQVTGPPGSGTEVELHVPR